MPNKDHWEKGYTSKAPDSVNWLQTYADMSMLLIRASGLGHDAAIIDIGAEASTRVDDMLDDGYANVTARTQEKQVHHMPFGTDHQFIYCMRRRQAT